MLEYTKEIASIGAALIGLLGKFFSRKRVAMIYADRYSLSHILPPFRDQSGEVTDPSPLLNVHSFIVRNSGKEPLSDVVVTLNWKPQSMNIYPSRPYEPHLGDHNRYSYRFTSLSPGEELAFEMVSVQAPLPGILMVASHEARARYIALVATPSVPRWRVLLIQTLSIAGIAAIVYIALWMLRGLISDDWTWRG